MGGYGWMLEESDWVRLIRAFRGCGCWEKMGVVTDHQSGCGSW